MSDFENKVIRAAQDAFLKFVGEGRWLELNYNARLHVPAEIISDAWGLVDRRALRVKLAERIESELADRIMNHLAAEMATDIKQLLSVQERREAIRALAREHMTAIMKAGAP